AGGAQPVGAGLADGGGVLDQELAVGAGDVLGADRDPGAARLGEGDELLPRPDNPVAGLAELLLQVVVGGGEADVDRVETEVEGRFEVAAAAAVPADQADADV